MPPSSPNTPSAFQTVAQKHPELAEPINYIQDQNAQMMQQLNALGQAKGISRSQRRVEIQQIHQATQQRVLNKYGAAGEQAMSLLAQEQQGDSVFGAIGKMFYDGDKGGVQIGGIVGALAGLAGGYFLTGGGGMDWLGIAGMALLTGLGAWAGTKAGDMINPSQTTPAAPESFQASAPALGLSKAVAYGPSEGAQKTANGGNSDLSNLVDRNTMPNFPVAAADPQHAPIIYSNKNQPLGNNRI